MEEELREINARFQSGKYKQSITEIQTLIEAFPTDDRIHKAYGRLGDYFDFMGQHVEAVEAWAKALTFLEDDVAGVDHLNEGKLIDWINISLDKARVMYWQGKDGPGVSRKHNSICYSSSKMNENDKAEWKKERIQTAINHYKKVLENFPENNLDTKRQIRTELAQTLFDIGNFEEAATIYEDAFNNDGDVEWLYQAANCSWHQGNKDQAYVRLQQLIGTEANFAKAYELCATYFTEKNDPTKADEYKRQYQFYSWIPRFCDHIEYNPENVLLIERINSDQALECVQTTLATDTSKRSTEILAAICYHHYHGPIENKAFQELKKRGKASEGEERDFIGSILMYLIKRHRSICTIKGAANALAGMKYDQTFEVLANLSPQDLNLLYPMHIPMALAKLRDPRAVPLLIKMIKKPIVVENDDSDSSDEFLASGGTNRLVDECRSALCTFFTHPELKEVLANETDEEETREMALAVLGVCTGEKQYFDELEKILTEGSTLDYMVVKYLEEHAEQSQQVQKLLKFNEEIYTNKAKKTNNNDDD